MTATIIKSGDYWLVQFGEHEIVSIHTDQDEAIAAAQKVLADRRCYRQRRERRESE